MAQHTIIFGLTGQTLRHVPTGVVSGASFVLEDLFYPVGQAERTIASGSATVASWSLTTDAAAGANQRNAKRIPVAATTGASIGAPAVIVTADGRRELFEVAAIASGDYIEAAHELAGEFASGSTVYGVLVSASVPNDYAADETELQNEHPLRVKWTYTLDGIERVVPELVEFARSGPSDALVGEAVTFLVKAYPDVAKRLPDGAELAPIAVLMADDVAADLRAREIDPAQFSAGDRMRRLVVQRVLAHLGDLGYSPGNSDQTAWAERARIEYRRQLESLTIGRPGNATAEPSKRDDSTSENPSTRHRTIFRNTP